MGGGGGGESEELIIFSHWGLPLYDLSTSTLSGIFDGNVGPFFGIFVPNGGLQNTILRAVLGGNGYHFSNVFLKLWIFSPD